jgi:hypothetical protein
LSLRGSKLLIARTFSHKPNHRAMASTATSPAWIE